MPLILLSESDIEDQYKLTIKQAIKSEASEQRKDDNVVKGKRLQLQRSELITNRVCVCCHLPTKKSQVSSYYPGHGDHSHVLARLDHANRDMFHSPAVDDDCTETEEDQTDDEDEDTVKNTHKHPTKFSESMLLEVSLKLSIISLKPF
jgi:hypothetical protein